MKHLPFFSVVIATYNRAHLLKRALTSLIYQSSEDWEAIIVDDESTDDTYSHVLPYIRSYPQIRYIKKKHSGSAMSKNSGICSSTGRFVTFLDSDDEYDPAHLESRKSVLLNYPSVRFLYGGITILGNQYVPDRFNNDKAVNLNDCMIGGAFFIERQTLFQLRGFRKILIGEDADLFDRAEKAGIVTKEVKNPTYIYHHESDDSITNKLYSSQQQAIA